MGINFRQELNDEQFAVATAGDGPGVVIAGAGSGKTRAIVYRVAYLLEQGVAPEEILLVTFTNKAAKEMIIRLEDLVGATTPLRAMWTGTFHSICNRILRSFGDRLGYTPNFTILDHDDSRALVKNCMKSLGIDMTNKRAPSPAVVQELVSYAKNAMRPLKDVVFQDRPSLNAFTDDIIATANLYTQRKKEMNAMDFDDLLSETLELLVIDEQIRQTLVARFRYVLVDEYQDTSPVQADLVRRLTGADGNLLVVGDDCQSIYGFRAADVRNILDFKRFHPRAKTYFLKTNYRSTPQIVSLANDIIEKNVDQYQKELVAACAAAEHPVIASFPSARQEASYIADLIDAHLLSGKSPREFAVLFRAAHHSQALEFELMQRGVTYEYRGGQRFFERSHVKDVLAFLRLAANVKDEAAWLRTAVLWDGVGETAAMKIAAAARSAEDLLHMVNGGFPKVSSRAEKGMQQYAALLVEIVKAATPADAIKAILGSSYVTYIEAQFPNAADRIADVEQLAVFAERYAAIPEFITDTTLDDALGSRNSRTAPLVILSTIHQAKGLEWETVVLMHLSSGNFPNRRSMDSQDDLEEERRLFYVAVTRAKRHLYMTFPTTGGGCGNDFTFAQPSLFLTELSPRVAQWKGDSYGFGGGSSYGGVTSKFPSMTDDSPESAFWEDEAVVVDETGAAMPGAVGTKKPKRTSFLRDV